MTTLLVGFHMGRVWNLLPIFLQFSSTIKGKPYGSRIYATNKRGMSGFCYILKPTNPDIWCVGPLEHQTQIIYPLDISQICFHLELSPGKRVIESGTGEFYWEIFLKILFNLLIDWERIGIIVSWFCKVPLSNREVGHF